MLGAILDVDVKTLVSVLFWGNLASVLPIAIYLLTSRNSLDRMLAQYYSAAKLCQGVAYFFLYFRGTMPDVLSVNLGNSLLLTGFALEAFSILHITDRSSKMLYRLVFGILLFSIALFNTMEFITPNPAVRVSAASICAFCILVIPSLKLLVSPNVGQFKRTIGFFYLVFLTLLLPRAFYAIKDTSVSIFTPFMAQVLTFLSLVLLLVFCLAAYLLFMKENADEVITTMASTDLLTGLSNRYSFLKVAEALFENAKISGANVTVLFMDLDNFKNVNDSYGHLFGDTVLKRYGAIIKGSLRAFDLSCRYGGEEFVALLPGADESNFQRVTGRIMDEVRKAEFPEFPDFKFTVSIGVVSGAPADHETLAQYIDMADRAMYVAKRRGRDCTVTYSDTKDESR